MAQVLKKRSRIGQRPFLHDLAHRPRASFRPERAFPQLTRWARVVDQSSRCSMDLERVAHARATLRRSNDVALADATDASTAAPRPARAALRAGSSRMSVVSGSSMSVVSGSSIKPVNTDDKMAKIGFQVSKPTGEVVWNCKGLGHPKSICPSEKRERTYGMQRASLK